MTESAERRLIAFLDGPDDPGVANPIHSTAVASAYGYRAALVGGVTVYGWCVPPILEVLGESWLDLGWADVSFRHPVYPGQSLHVTVVPRQSREASFEVQNGAGDTCVAGTAGLGLAAWLESVEPPMRLAASPPPEPKPELTLDSAPVGNDLHAMVVPTPPDSLDSYARELQQDAHPRWYGSAARLHPAWLAARMSPLFRHNFTCGPSIHARGQLQHLAPATAGPDVTVRARLSEVYERKGHHYAIFDGLVTVAGGTDVLRVRHTSIFRPATRGQ